MKRFFRQPAFIASVLVSLLCWGSPGRAQSLVRDFEDFFDRCRVSIETNTAFDTNDMTQINVPKRDQQDWGLVSTQSAWTRQGSELLVVLTEWTSSDGTTRHLCDINLAEETRALSEVEQALLLRKFMMDRVRRLADRTHEIAMGLSPIPPNVNAGYMLAGRNPNGCKVINDIAFAPDGSFFSAGSGEQAIHPCARE